MPRFPLEPGADRGRPAAGRGVQVRPAPFPGGAPAGIRRAHRVRAPGHLADGVPRLLPRGRRPGPVGQVAADRGRPGPRVGDRIAGGLPATDHRPRPDRAPADLRAVPQPGAGVPPDIDLDFDERRRGEVLRYIVDRWGEENVAQVITFGTIKTKAAIKDAARVIHGQPGFAIADRISKALPPPIMAKDIPLSGIFDPAHERYAEATEVRTLSETDPEVGRIMSTARGLEGLVRNAGVHACAVIMSSEPLLDVIPLWKRDDGSVITGWDYPSCEAIGLLKMDCLGLRTLTVVDDTIKAVEANHGVSVLPTSGPELADKKTYELLSRGETLGVFQLDGAAMRSLLKAMAPTHFGDIAAVLPCTGPARWRRTRTSTTPSARTGARRSRRSTRAGRRARTDPGRDLPPAGLPGAGHGHRPAARRLLPRPGGPAAPRDGQEEEGDHREGVRGLPGGHARQGLLRGGLPDPVGRHAALRRVRVQQVPHRRLRARVVLDGLPQGELPDRVHGRAAHLDRRRQGQVGDLPRRMPADADPGPSAGRQRVRARVHRRRGEHPVRARRGAQRRRERHRVDRPHPQGEGRVHLLHRLHGEGRAGVLQQAHHRVADQGRRVRLVRPAPARAAGRPRDGVRRRRLPEAAGGAGASTTSSAAATTPRPQRTPHRWRSSRSATEEWPRKILLAHERDMLGPLRLGAPAGRHRADPAQARAPADRRAAGRGAEGGRDRRSPG